MAAAGMQQGPVTDGGNDWLAADFPEEAEQQRPSLTD